jgi:serine/threonine protein kinase
VRYARCVAAPLTSLECELLEAIAHDRDPSAIAVLGDYWIEHVDEERGAFVQLSAGENAERIDLADEEARLAEHAQRWRQLAMTAGYPERDLVLVDGFLQWPMVVPAGHWLDGHPDIVRISPRYYREHDRMRYGLECTVHEAHAVTPRTTTRVALKEPNVWVNHDIIDHEYAILQLLDHPNIVRSLGYGVTPRGRALALEWCGIDVRQLMSATREHRMPLGIDVALSAGVQLFDAVAAVHRAQMIHREVRSDHVAIAADGTVRLIDFGTTSCLGPGPRFCRYDRYVSPGVQGDLRYRLNYMSREQCRGVELTQATDVYSAAVVIAELAANEHPVPDLPTQMGILAHVMREQIEPAATLPPPLRIALRLGLDRARDLRPTASAMREMLLATARMLGLDIGPHVIARRLVELGVPT